MAVTFHSLIRYLDYKQWFRWNNNEFQGLPREIRIGHRRKYDEVYVTSVKICFLNHPRSKRDIFLVKTFRYSYRLYRQCFVCLFSRSLRAEFTGVKHLLPVNFKIWSFRCIIQILNPFKYNVLNLQFSLTTRFALIRNHVFIENNIFQLWFTCSVFAEASSSFSF